MLPVRSSLQRCASGFALLKWLAPITALVLGTGLVDVQHPLAEQRLVQSSDCGFSLAVTGHLDKRKASSTAGITIHDHSDRLNRPKRFEQSSELIARRSVIQVADENVFHGFSP